MRGDGHASSQSSVDAGVERGVERGDALVDLRLEDGEVIVERGVHLGGVRRDAAVERIDIVLQAVGDVLRALAEPVDDLAAERLHGAVEFSDVARDQVAQRARVARELLGELGAVGLHQVVERADPRGDRVVGVLRLVDDLRDQRVDGDVQRFGGLVAAHQHILGEPGAGFVDAGREIGRAQVEFEDQRLAGRLQRLVHLLGAVGDAVDDRVRLLLEFGGDALEPLVHHVVDAVGQVDEVVVHVAGLEVQAGGQPLARLQDGARGLGARLLEAVEQVAATLAERENHAVAGVAERAGDVLAAVLQAGGDALGHFIDARGDLVADHGDVLAQVDLHAGNRVAHLFGLADQVVALMGDVLQQGADTHLVVAVGAFERCDLVGYQCFQFAGARDRAFDAVAHRRDFAADRLADRDHRLARRTFRLGVADRHLRHRLRDHAQFLAAPGEAGEEIEQQDRREQQRGKARDHQDAGALAEHRLQRGQEGDNERADAGEPEPGKDCCDRVDVAPRTALLDSLQQLTDGLAIVVGRASRCGCRLVAAQIDAVGGDVIVEGGRKTLARNRGNRLGTRRRRRAVGAILALAAVKIQAGRGRVRDVQRFLNGGQRDFGGIFDLFGIVRHLDLRPHLLVGEAIATPRRRFCAQVAYP